MEFFLLLPLLFCITVFASIFLNKLISKKQNPQPNDQNIPLPPGKTGWPLIGETFDYYSNIRKGVLENFVTDRVTKYSSKVFKTSLIGHPVAILCGPEGNKFLFSNEQNLVRVWFPTAIDKIFPKSRNVSTADYFKKTRRIVSSFLKADAIRCYVGVMDEVMMHHLVTDWDRCEKVTVSDVVRKYTVTLACRLLLSINDPRRVEEFAAAMMEIEGGILSPPVNFPGMPLNRAIKASRMVRKEIEAIVIQRKIDVWEKNEDILSQLLIATDEDGKFFNESDISSHLLGLMQGGYSTVNGTLTFIIKYLAELPHVYNEVLREQMEIKNSKEPNELLNWEDLRKMSYSWNVVKEVLRLMPTGAFREAITDFTYAGYLIPKGWKLPWIAHYTHKNTEYFPNPEKFDPSRFEGNGPAPYTFVPFGGGPRMCPGIEYSRLAILVFIHNVVTKFRWKMLIPDEKVLCDPLPRPSHGLPVCLHPHNQ